MTRKEIYNLYEEVNKNIDIIRNDQASYLNGVERGIDLMFCAVRNYLAKEEAAQNEKGGEGESENT